MRAEAHPGLAAQARVELLKLRTTRLVWGLFAGALALTAVNVVANALVAGNEGLPPLDSVAGVRTVFSSASSGTVFTMVLGVLAVTQEFRHGTISWAFLAHPRRGPVIAAKLVALPIVSLGFAMVGVLVTVALALPLLAIKGAEIPPGADVGQILLGSAAGVTLYSVLGIGFGALVRNQVAAVTSSLLYVLLLESSLVTFLPEVGRWTPGGAAAAMTLTEPARGVELLPPWAGGVLFLGYGLALAWLGTISTLRRDVT